MKKKEIILLINEEISNFDFLNNEAYTQEKENLDLIQNEDFQKQFLIDSILKREKISIKVSDARITGDWENSDSGSFGVEYYTEITYTYDSTKDPSIFILSFDGTDVQFSTKADNDPGDRLTAPYNETWFDFIDWTAIDVGLSTLDGDSMRFIAYEKAPDKIKNIFVREYLEGFVSNQTEREVRQKKDNMNTTLY